MATITQHHQFDAPPRTIFNALTDPTTLCTWWTSAAESDPTIGGEFRLEFRHTPEALAEGKQDMVQEGKYIECDVNTIQYPWQVGPAMTSVRFVLNYEAGGTDLKLVHSAVPDDDATTLALSAGWDFFLNNLSSVLADGPDGREAAGMVTGVAVAGSR